MKLIGTQVAVGIIKNKRNNLWQVWASLDGNDVTCLSAHRIRSAAQTVADEFARAYENEELDTPKKVAAFIDNIQQDAMPMPLSQISLQEIGREIADAIRLHQIALKK